MYLNKYKRQTSFFVLLLLLFHEAVVPIVVFAQETTTETVTPTPAVELSTTTGEATADAESNNVVNETETVAPAMTDDCAIVGGCAGVTSTDNTADLGTNNTATSDTGNNTSVGTSTTVSIETGNATSTNSNQNQVNNTTTVLEIGNNTPTPSISVTNTDNIATISTDNSSTANTGNNKVEVVSSDAKITTGEAVAYANVINLVNTNFSGSQIGIYFYNDLGVSGNVDLNQIWKNINENNGVGIATIQKGSVDSGTNIVIISNHNIASVNNKVSVIATSGENTISGEKSDGLILTGDATALANVINVINANIVGANFFIGVINLSANSLGDIVLPHPDSSANQNNCIGCSSTISKNNNQVTTNSSVSTTSITGNNQTTTAGSSTIATGEAVAISNQNTLANIDVRSSGQMMVMMNVLGKSSGKIYNWLYPGSVEDWTDSQKLFVMTQFFGDGGDTNNGLTYLLNDNRVTLNSQINAVANTGENSIIGANNASIKTGKATSISNLTNLLNLNILGNNWFYGVINIVGDWNGNTVFAYPDVTVEIDTKSQEVKVGEEVEYQIRYSNMGYETARNVKIEMTMSEGIEYAGDDSGIDVEKTGTKITWVLEKLDSGAQRYFLVRAKVSSKQLMVKRPWWQLVEPVFAGENIVRSEVETKVSISTTDVESDRANNTGSIKIVTMKIVKTVENTQQGEKSDRKPNIQLKGVNNVNSYVYPNDIVTFDFDLKNIGEGKARESVLTHEIVDENGKVWRQDQLFLGDLDRGMEGKLGFGVVINIEDNEALVHDKKFTTRSKITSKTERGDDYSSNTVETVYGVRFLGTKQKVALAIEKSAGEVLGEAVAPVCKPEDNIAPYLLVFVISGLWLYGKSSYWMARLRKK